MPIGLTTENAPARPAAPPIGIGVYPYWLVALIEPRREKRVRDWLWSEAAIPSWAPIETTIRRRGVKRVKTKVETPLLRGYLFVPALSWDYAGLHAAKGIRGWMHHEATRDAPARLVMLPDAALSPLREIEASLAATMGQRRFRKGQAVRIAEGAFTGLVASVAALRAGLTVQVDTPLGRMTVDESAIEPAA